MNDRQQDRARAELAAVPPREFRRARQALALRLAKAGEARAAAAVRKITRPTVPVWMVNRLAREATPAVEQLVKTAGRMRAAQLGRSGSAGALRSAAQAHHEALAHLVEQARRKLTEAGPGASHRLLLRIENTLDAAAADPALHGALRQGRLDRELDVRGFDVFAAARGKLRAPRSEERTRVAQRAGKRRGGRAPRRTAPLTVT